ncbi:DHH family phosphoesterase [Candidatus Woesearchaeota archaeon]|nr:DHH family phosphoesterase [Candidatus Woesearchaeota archaeon]
MLPKKQIEEIRDELKHCKRPLFFFDDDADGLSSFLLLYRYIKEGSSVVIKTIPKIDNKFLRKVKEYEPDKIFILDIAQVEQGFIDAVKIPIIWIDHHGPFECSGNIKYFNPRLIKKDLLLPATGICYEVVKQDLWIAMVGCIGDYYMPDFFDEFKKKYADLIGDSKSVEDIYFNSKFGKLIDLFSFILKGKTSDALKHVKVLTRIKEPYEILNEETPQGKFLFKKYKQINEGYETLLNEALKAKPEQGFFIFIYPDNNTSFTSELSNELLYRFSDNVIIVGREKNGDIKMSLRSKHKTIPEALARSLAGLEGYGGGHEHACGANVKKEQFEEFVKRLRENLN